MDASIRDTGCHCRIQQSQPKPCGKPAVEVGRSRSTTSSRRHLSGLRVALVHDWLTGMRGGEKCLEVLCRAFPRRDALHPDPSAGLAQPGDRVDDDPDVAAPAVPGVFRHYRHLLPIMPLAARAWRPKDVDLVISLSHCVAKAVVPPPGVPHVCYCFTPMRYAWQGRDTYLESWSRSPRAPGAGPDDARRGSGAGTGRRRAG